MTTLGWVLLVLATLLLGGFTTVIVKFWDKLKPILLKLIDLVKKINYYELYEKAQKSGALDKVVDVVKSRKKT